MEKIKLLLVFNLAFLLYLISYVKITEKTISGNFWRPTWDLPGNQKQKRWINSDQYSFFHLIGYYHNFVLSTLDEYFAIRNLWRPMRDSTIKNRKNSMFASTVMFVEMAYIFFFLCVRKKYFFQVAPNMESRKIANLSRFRLSLFFYIGLSSLSHIR